MSEYVNAALYVYGAEGEQYMEAVENNPFGTEITLLPFDRLAAGHHAIPAETGHVVVCGELPVIKAIMQIAHDHDLSVGILPLDNQTQLINSYGLPRDPEEALAIALKSDAKTVDLVYCNNSILLFKGSVGRVPLIDNPESAGRFGLFRNAIRRLLSLHLLPFTITTKGSNKITLATAATGFLLFENPEKSFATRIVSHDFSLADKMVSMVIVAPLSIVAYLHLMLDRLFFSKDGSPVPDSIGYIKSPHFIVESEVQLKVNIDGEVLTSTPLECKVVEGAIRLNHGKDLSQESGGAGKEKAITRSLPVGKEILKAGTKRVPFFTYASEERFKDLFVSLRDDARINSTYVVLMVLSTVLATVGLYLNSGSVIIGAMLLAPLMSPIISMAMSLLRYERKLFRQSFYKVCLGIFLALGVSALLSLLSPYQPFTQEMQGRLHPSTLDLLVAFAAGVAGAYTKSYKEILQSLAGVAIAVALVPPLAVAGIGLGRLDLVFFQQAFLLFATNLVGIILAATLSFRVLGFSPVVRDKLGMIVVLVFFAIISTPLFMAFQSIVEKSQFEQGWKDERFLVNEKYLIVNSATLHKFKERDVLTVEVYAREPLNRMDLTIFRRKIQRNFTDDLVIRANVIYIP